MREIRLSGSEGGGTQVLPTPIVKRRFPIRLSTVRFAKTLSCYCSSGAARPAIFDTQPDFSLPNQINATDSTNTLIWTALDADGPERLS